MTRGKLVAYGFDLVPTGGNLPRMAADVSQKGGHLVWAVNTRAPGPPRLSTAEATRVARDFLRDDRKLGRLDLEPLLQFRAGLFRGDGRRQVGLAAWMVVGEVLQRVEAQQGNWRLTWHRSP
jgi:hypothetical protein